MTSLALEHKAAVGGLVVSDGNGAGEFRGRASTFGSLDSYGDIVVPGAFSATLPDFVQRGFITAGHDWASPVGYVLSAEEKSDGLWVRAAFHSDPASQTVRLKMRERLEAHRHVALSIGYSALEHHRDASGHRILTKIGLHEIAIVSIGAEPQAHVVGAKTPPVGPIDPRLTKALQDQILRLERDENALSVAGAVLVANQRALDRGWR